MTNLARKESIAAFGKRNEVIKISWTRIMAQPKKEIVDKVLWMRQQKTLRDFSEEDVKNE